MPEPGPIVFGPVPSRRLGRSLGVNMIPSKYCTYACPYCQVGLTTHHVLDRRTFWSTEETTGEVLRRVRELRSRNERIDYLSFVPDGEPTLDAELGPCILALRPLGIPIAVISNGSPLTSPEVRASLGLADWVSVKVDAARPRTWKRMNRPHRAGARSKRSCAGQETTGRP